MNAGTIFGRQPVVWVGLIQAVLVTLVSFGWLSFIGLDSQQDVGLVAAVLFAAGALYLAFVTSESWLAPAVEVLKALFALGAIYGLSVTTEQTGLLIGLLTVAFSFVHQGKTSPLDAPTLREVNAYTGDQWRINQAA